MTAENQTEKDATQVPATPTTSEAERLLAGFLQALINEQIQGRTMASGVPNGEEGVA